MQRKYGTYLAQIAAAAGPDVRQRQHAEARGLRKGKGAAVQCTVMAVVCSMKGTVRLNDARGMA